MISQKRQTFKLKMDQQLPGAGSQVRLTTVDNDVEEFVVIEEFLCIFLVVMVL